DDAPLRRGRGHAVAGDDEIAEFLVLVGETRAFHVHVRAAARQPDAEMAPVRSGQRAWPLVWARRDDVRPGRKQPLAHAYQPAVVAGTARPDDGEHPAATGPQRVRRGVDVVVAEFGQRVGAGDEIETPAGEPRGP